MKPEIDKIILDYLTGDISSEDRKKLNTWLEEDPLNRKQLDLISKVWKVPLGYPGLVNMADEEKKIWDRIQGKNEEKTTVLSGTESVARGFLKIAAVLIAIISIGYFLWYFNKHYKTEKAVVLVKMINRTNPPGQKSRIHLPDGSIVILNASSQLTYSGDFNRINRKIHLIGEAYFEVAKNPEIPFEVYTDDLVITAIGTSFNVNAFENKETEKVALQSGKVKIECIAENNKCSLNYLNPGELAVYSQKTGDVNISEFKDLDPFGWKEGRIVYHHATFNEVLEVLERWYNVDFEVHGSLKKEWDYSATFENEILKNILGSLKFSEKIDYRISGSKIVINL